MCSLHVFLYLCISLSALFVYPMFLFSCASRRMAFFILQLGYHIYMSIYTHFLFLDALQISEVVNSMKDLIDYSKNTRTGPMGELLVIFLSLKFLLVLIIRRYR